jgi:putative sterol carrier protein
MAIPKLLDPREAVKATWAFHRRNAAGLLRGSVRVAGVAFGIPAVAVPMLSSILTRLDPDGGGAKAYPFLSEEWIEAARAVRAELEGKATVKPPPFRMNQIVTEVPFGDGTLQAHADTTSGELVLELGHIESPDVTVTLPYDTAKSLLVDQDQQAAMQAFMSGKIKVEGDMMKLMALQTTQVDPVALEAAARIKEITA